jgi:chromosomal replication initiator protein
MTSDPLTAAEIWQTAYGELQLQMPREAFDTWLRNARLLASEDGTFIIGVHNIYAREWLEHRLKKVIVRALSQIAGRSVEVRFVIWTADETQADLSSAGPLLAELEPPAAPAARFERLLPGETGLNPRYTFDEYAVGPSNRLAHAAAQAVGDQPGTQFNPLYLHAGVGLGKTHLLHAIGHSAAGLDRRVLFVTAERFTNDLMAAIRAKTNAEFREKYRTLDLLLVDDIDFLAGKDSTQEEFYHTFNILYDLGAQIAVAGSQPPAGLRKLDTRLASRFDGGLVVEITPPDYETRLQILSLKARQRGFDGRIPAEVFEVIAEESLGSVRELEGAFNRVIAAAMLHQEAPTVNLAETVIGETRDGQEAPTLDSIILAVAEYYGLEPDELTGRGRSREVSGARQVAMYLAYKHTDTSLQHIGEALGGRNHSTVLYSCERISDLMATDTQVRREIGAILAAMHVVPQARHRHGE